ncbi:hypothetical protein EVG20_g77 [Dentipellis fragilis]|uniref:BHLH domain-containing protein n=1 Tax=Dentipellis fragilis TaxID=205917 RepID=A0A4Y9ZGH4_9AGAM|nr:hypothetical protein EVG20_g77 [Dentipellis fragilis]
MSHTSRSASLRPSTSINPSHIALDNKSQISSQQQSHAGIHQDYQSPLETMGDKNLDSQQWAKQIDDFLATYSFDPPHLPVQGAAAQTFNDYDLALPSSNSYAADHFQQTPSHAGLVSSAGVPDGTSSFGVGQHAAEVLAAANTTASGNERSYQTSSTDPSELTLAAQGMRNDDQRASTSTAPSPNKRKRKASIIDSEDDQTPQEKAQRERAAHKQRKNRENICEILVKLNELLPPDLRSKVKKPNHRVIDTAIPYFRIMKNELDALKSKVVGLEAEVCQRQESEGRFRSEKMADEAKQEVKLSEMLTKLQDAESREREATEKANYYKQQLMAVLQKTRTNVQS